MYRTGSSCLLWEMNADITLGWDRYWHRVLGIDRYCRHRFGIGIGKNASIPAPILRMRHVCVIKTVVLCFDCTQQRKKQHSSTLKCHANRNALHHLATPIPCTLRRHYLVCWELPLPSSASSQVSPILGRSFLTMPPQFVLGRPGPLLKPGTSQCSAWCVMRRWSIRIVWPSQRSLLPLRMFRMLCCPVLALTSSFVTLSFQQTPNMLLSHVWWAPSCSRFDSVTVSGHSSALYRRVDKMTDSYCRIFTFKLILFFQIFFTFSKIVAAFPTRTYHLFRSFRCMQCSC